MNTVLSAIALQWTHPKSTIRTASVRSNATQKEFADRLTTCFTESAWYIDLQ